MDNKLIKYPIYIISKGRYRNSLTANFLKQENIDFKIAVESKEYRQYCKYIGENHVIDLNYSDIGLGSYPARNFCWEHSIKEGHSHHFLFDDNIRCFSRLNYGKRKKTSAIESLVVLQNFTDRYSNIALSGYNYRYFVTRNQLKPFTINTHVYSGMLIRNDLKYRWRLKYNEDVDLCLQALNDKWCTVLFSAFLIDKTSTTVKMSGGNQDELYKNNDYSKKVLKTMSLKQMWPQYVKETHRFGRPHHQVSWAKHFKHPLKRKNNYEEIVSSQIKYGAWPG